MQFLAPLFFAALAALAVPVILHIRRRRPRERVGFSAVRFFEESAPVQRRHVRLERILLLLLRCLAITLVVLAFTRPFLADESAAASGGRRDFILIDTSASMRGGKLTDAKQKADAILDAATPDTRMAIAVFDDGFHPLRSFDSGDVASARAAIRSIEAGWRTTNLAAAIEGACDLISQDRETSGSEEAVIHLVSDLQQTAVIDGLDGFPWPPGVRVAPVQIGGDNWTNAGVHIDVSTRGRSVRVVNSAGSESAEFRVEWPAAAAQPLRVEPGSAMDLPVRPDSDRVVLRGDPFEFDNRAWIAPETGFTVAVDYIGADAPDDSSGSLFFLSKVFAATSQPAIQLRANPSDSGNPALTIIDRPLNNDTARAVRTTLEDGGHALLVLRDAGMQSTLSALAGTDIPVEEVVPERPALLGRIDFEDPVFAPFSDPKFSNFSSIATWRYRQMSAPERARVLAAFSSGDPALLRIPTGKGTLFVLTSSWRPQDSQLALSSKFAPLLLAMLSESPAFHPPPTQVHVGDEVRLPRDAATEIRTPDGRTVRSVDGVFLETTGPGLYRTVNDQFVFAVNPPPQETDLTPLPTASLRALGIPIETGEVSIPTAESRSVTIRADTENRQKWWRWLILAAIVALVTETAVAAWSSRNQAVHS